jgi:hypothetical protein
MSLRRRFFGGEWDTRKFWVYECAPWDLNPEPADGSRYLNGFGRLVVR